ncbi:hypothetical protein [Paenibacillus stellifer]|uniref:hypothetical protein n=1 Tax=Paenibacillus stellifer TaxID=169760 RepID=UPI00147076C7|nr:hypothetical protein [Paenibacillus stellifer]
MKKVTTTPFTPGELAMSLTVFAPDHATFRNYLLQYRLSLYFFKTGFEKYSATYMASAKGFRRKVVNLAEYIPQ